MITRVTEKIRKKALEDNQLPKSPEPGQWKCIGFIKTNSFFLLSPIVPAEKQKNKFTVQRKNAVTSATPQSR